MFKNTKKKRTSMCGSTLFFVKAVRWTLLLVTSTQKGNRDSNGGSMTCSVTASGEALEMVFTQRSAQHSVGHGWSIWFCYVASTASFLMVTAVTVMLITGDPGALNFCRLSSQPLTKIKCHSLRRILAFYCGYDQIWRVLHTSHPVGHTVTVTEIWSQTETGQKQCIIV